MLSPAVYTGWSCCRGVISPHNSDVVPVNSSLIKCLRFQEKILPVLTLRVRERVRRGRRVLIIVRDYWLLFISHDQHTLSSSFRSLFPVRSRIRLMFYVKPKKNVFNVSRRMLLQSTIDTTTLVYTEKTVFLF